MAINKNHYCIIMAGGIGSRFWPASRRNCPKQFLDILGTGKTFIRHTFERFIPIIPTENFLVVTNATYKDLVLENLPELKSEQVLCEPIGRNTAPCIAHAAFRLRVQNPDAAMVKELTGLVAKVIGYGGEIRWDTSKPNGTPRKLLDVSKAAALGWTYKTELEEGIRLSYQDFLENPIRAER